MREYAITIIVPIYQVEKYIGACLQSIVESAMFEQCEILLVDDGSKDGSADIALQYARQYKNCFLIRKENGGAGSARNLGIERANGKYLYFIDGDDFVSCDRLKRLWSQAESGHCDMVLASYREYVEGKEETVETNRDYLITSEPITGRAMIHLRMDYSDWMNQSFTALCRREMMVSHQIYFPNENVLYEDIIWMNQCLLQAQRVSYVPDCGYYYRKREGSAVSHLNGINKRDLTDSMKCLTDFKYWYEDAEIEDKPLIGRLALRMVTMPVEYLACVRKEERKYYFHKIEEMKWAPVFKKSARTKIEYVKAFLYSMGIPVFAVAMKQYKGNRNGTD